MLKPLVDDGSAKLIATIDDLAHSLGSGESTFKKEYYFEPHATQTMCKVITRLKKEGTAYQSR